MGWSVGEVVSLEGLPPIKIHGRSLVEAKKWSVCEVVSLEGWSVGEVLLYTIEERPGDNASLTRSGP